MSEYAVLDDNGPLETVDITGVPETMLWPLWHRAAEQRRARPLLHDPLSARLVERIDYDFRGRFGRPSVLHAVRARLCDDLVKDYARGCDEEPLVIALGDGLDTQCWRLDDETIRWFSIDLPEAMTVRQRLLPPHPRQRNIACSVLDPAWLEQVPAHSAPFVSAAGLLMYFDERDVVRLLATVADRFPAATIYFDTIPRWFSQKTLAGFKVTPRYTAPPMPWGIAVDDIPQFLSTIPGLGADRVWTYADPYPQRTWLLHKLARIRFVRERLAPGLAVARAYRKTASGYRG